MAKPVNWKARVLHYPATPRDPEIIVVQLFKVIDGVDRFALQFPGDIIGLLETMFVEIKARCPGLCGEGAGEVISVERVAVPMSGDPKLN